LRLAVFVRHLVSFADRLAEPVLIGITSKIRKEVHRILTSVAVVAAGIAFLVAGIAYFASSLWHALQPSMGNVGADLFLGFLYGGMAAALLFLGFRLTR
jgi:hypothetical protein